MELPVEVWREILYYFDYTILKRFIFVNCSLSRRIFNDNFFWQRVFTINFQWVHFFDHVDEDENVFKKNYKKIYEEFKKKELGKHIDKKSFLKNYTLIEESGEERLERTYEEIKWRKAYDKKNRIMFIVCEVDTEGEEESFRRCVDLEDLKLWRVLSLKNRTILNLYEYFFDDKDDVLYCILEYDEIVSLSSIFDAKLPKNFRMRNTDVEKTFISEDDVRFIIRKLMDLFKDMGVCENKSNGKNKEATKRSKNSDFQIRVEDLLINKEGKVRISPLLGIKYDYHRFRNRRN